MWIVILLLRLIVSAIYELYIREKTSRSEEETKGNRSMFARGSRRERFTLGRAVRT